MTFTREVYTSINTVFYLFSANYVNYHTYSCMYINSSVMRSNYECFDLLLLRFFIKTTGSTYSTPLRSIFFHVFLFAPILLL